MGYFNRFFGHLKTVLTHKRWVFYYASRLGYTWRGLVHDMSKFSPAEFFEGVRYWTGKRSPVIVAKEKTGISYAWLHHRGMNKHHYEYWIDKLNDGGVPHKMPFKYVVEMVCDRLGACRAYEGETGDIFAREYEWWRKNGETAKIHPETKALIRTILWNLAETRGHTGNERATLREIRSFLPYWETMYNKRLFVHENL
jgi:hypothetical protein